MRVFVVFCVKMPKLRLNCLILHICGRNSTIMKIYQKSYVQLFAKIELSWKKILLGKILLIAPPLASSTLFLPQVIGPQRHSRFEQPEFLSCNIIKYLIATFCFAFDIL